MTRQIDDYTGQIHTGNCFDILEEMPENSVHAVVADGPYGLAFMGQSWDEFEPLEYQRWSCRWAKKAKRVLKPGGHLLSFSGTRTYHRMASGVEDAGYEIRDCLMWAYGTGFPKALDVSKAIDKQAGKKDERNVVGESTHSANRTERDATALNCANDGSLSNEGRRHITAPATPEAEQWDGFKTSLKPAFEPVVVARKPLSESTVAENVLQHGTGALNIDSCRIPLKDSSEAWEGDAGFSECNGVALEGSTTGKLNTQNSGLGTEGRYPANLVLDEQAGAMLDEQSGELTSGALDQDSVTAENNIYSKHDGYNDPKTYKSNSGGASRFFKTAEYTTKEREILNKTLNSERTVDGIECQLCKRTLASSAGESSKPTHIKSENTVDTTATSSPGADETTKPSSVNTAETSSKTFPQTSDRTAQKSATENQNGSNESTNANTAGTSSNPKRKPGDFAQKAARQAQESTQDNETPDGTTNTSNDSERNSTDSTKRTTSFERRLWHALKQDKSIQTHNPAKFVEVPMQIGTTTTTTTLLMCDGCAEAVTSTNTKKNMGHGAQDSQHRFKYCAKASKAERTLDGAIDNKHPTVKPVDLMDWLVTLVTAEDQIVLDPFAGSGTTCKAAKEAGREFIGIEKNAEYADIARARCGLKPADPEVLTGDEQSALSSFVKAERAETDGGQRK